MELCQVELCPGKRHVSCCAFLFLWVSHFSKLGQVLDQLKRHKGSFLNLLRPQLTPWTPGWPRVSILRNGLRDLSLCSQALPSSSALLPFGHSSHAEQWENCSWWCYKFLPSLVNWLARALTDFVQPSLVDSCEPFLPPELSSKTNQVLLLSGFCLLHI